MVNTGLRPKKGRFNILKIVQEENLGHMGGLRARKILEIKLLERFEASIVSVSPYWTRGWVEVEFQYG